MLNRTHLYMVQSKHSKHKQIGTTDTHTHIHTNKYTHTHTHIFSLFILYLSYRGKISRG